MEETSEACGDYGYETDPARSDYDVFLSFRGPDTRHGITDHLYESMTDKGIRVFRDDEEIRRGEEIGGELERAIHGSRVYVVVFSRNYASSAWCLRELTMMVDCCRDSAAGKIILSIFYDVDPYDVKLRTDLYRSNLDKHKKRYEEEEVKRWEEALVKVGGISGWDYKGYQGEGKFVRLIVQDVLSKLKIRDRRLPDHLTGIDDRVDGLMDLLNCDSPEVRVVMVHGMGGIGKTTLANVIFNRIKSQFVGSSFLPDVRETSAGQGGIANLQKKLLSDICGPMTEVGNSSDGMNLIKRRLRGKRLLIVFDDVSEGCQLDELVGNCDFFGSGTRIIVTTRDNSVCNGLMRFRDVYAYEMKEMSDDHALRLFSRHAFGGEGPPDNFAALSEQVIHTTRNLPLALVVIGGHLYGESKNVWASTLQNLKRVPHKDVMKILRISYEGLEDREKQNFLDIACFSNAIPRRYASYMWEARGLHPKWGVAILQNKSLVKVLNDNEFGMHDLIRDMGREIVCLEGLESLGMRSRLWDPEDALNVVRQKEGTNKVLAINLGKLLDDHHLACEKFEGMSNLRFLLLSGGQFIGDLGNFLTKLMWLHWKDCKQGPNLAFFNTNNLVVLNISGEGITDELMKDLRMGNLKALEIRHSPLTTTPDLSWCSKLESIIIISCFRLQTLHSSVGKLEVLALLHIKNCWSLRSLPEELGSAKALQELSLIGCYRVEALPESIGRLGDLRALCVRLTWIRMLPASIGALSSLEALNLIQCELCELPRTIHQLSCLRFLLLSDCRELQELPELPTSLTKLRVQVCNNLEKLSDLECMRRLRSLHLIYCPRLVNISGVEKMEQLEVLTIFSCDSLGRIADLSALTRLKRVHISNCPSLVGVPCMTGECGLAVDGCGELDSFIGPYRQYHHKRKREEES